MPTNVFIAFAKEDSDVRDKLLRQMNLVKDREGWNIWAAHEIKAGAVWSEEIKARLADSEAVVLLMSSSFFNSKYILKEELPVIIEKHRAGNCCIIPVLARVCHWQDTPFGEYAALGDIQALPGGGRPIVSKGAWDSDDEPYLESVAGIKDSIRAFLEKKEQEAMAMADRIRREKEMDERMKAHATALSTAEQDNTEQSWKSFLENFPDSPFYEKAIGKLEELQIMRFEDQKRHDELARKVEAADRDANIIRERIVERQPPKKQKHELIAVSLTFVIYGILGFFIVIWLLTLFEKCV